MVTWVLTDLPPLSLPAVLCNVTCGVRTQDHNLYKSMQYGSSQKLGPEMEEDANNDIALHELVSTPPGRIACSDNEVGGGLELNLHILSLAAPRFTVQGKETKLALPGDSSWLSLSRATTDFTIKSCRHHNTKVVLCSHHPRLGCC